MLVDLGLAGASLGILWLFGLPVVPDVPVVVASPVPEPSSLVLLLLGMSSGGAVRVWRRRSSREAC